jgi:hypothetical protein
VFENTVLRRIFESKREDGTGNWRKQHVEELHDLYSLTSVHGVIKESKMRWAEHVACLAERRNSTSFLVGKLHG